MARKKVNLQWITNDSTRRCTFNKRSNALMKKASDLSTLCGVKVSVVVYKEDETRPEVYPSVPEARQQISSFKAMPDDLENLKKVLNQEQYLRSRISKLRDQKGKSNHEKREDETSHLLHAAMAGHGLALPGLTTDELVRLKLMVEKKIGNAKAHFEQIVGQGAFQEPLVPPEEKPMVSSQSQLQTPYTSTEMQPLAPAKEPKTQEQDWLADLAWDGGELDPMVYSDVGIVSGGVGPSTNAGDIMQKDNMEG